MSIESKVDEAYRVVNAGFRTGKTLPGNYRLQQLQLLRKSVISLSEDINQALLTDLNRSHTASRLTETDMVLDMVSHAIQNLSHWQEAEEREIPPLFYPATAQVRYQPYGVALIIGSWNFPFDLTIGPLIDAISAGNAAVIKPSELGPASAEVVERILNVLDHDCFQVIQGGAEAASYLLTKRWDVICFTGSTAKGHLVAQAAAKFMTPLILELGGKNPAIVDETADLENAALRVAQGRFMNAGQMCISPEYVLVHKSVEKQFTETLLKTIKRFFGEDPKKSPDLGRIVSEQSAIRISKMLEGHDGEVLLGGASAPQERYIPPTIIKNPSLTSSLMQEEIFGPVLLLFPYTDLPECVSFLNARPKPLVIYYFGSSQTHFQTLQSQTFSGALSRNETAFHFGINDLPFGGVGDSGVGRTHGFYGFKAFSNARAIYQKDTFNGYPVSLRYPPYNLQGETAFFRVKAILGTLFGLLRSKPVQWVWRNSALLVVLGLWVTEPKTKLMERLLSLAAKK